MSQDNSLVGNLKKLTQVRKGQNVLRVASSERVNAIQETLKALVRGDNVVAGENLRKKKGEGYFVLSGNRGGRGGPPPDVTETPFQVVQLERTPEDTSTGDLVGVISNSHLFNSEDRDTYEEDNTDWGLLEDDRPPGDIHAWVDNYLGDKIWLQIELDEDQVIIAIDIVHGVVGSGLWGTYPNPIELNDDDPGNVYQQFYHQIIAEVTDPEEDPRPGLIVKNDADQEVQITQCLFTNLMLTTAHTTRDSAYPDVPLVVPVPWNLPGTAIDGSADEINEVTDPGPGNDPVTPWAYGPVSETAQTPFKVIPVPFDGDDAIGVISNSHLLNSESRNDYEELNFDWGLLSDDETTGSFSAPNIGEKIWLEIELDPEDQAIVSINIEWGSAWEQYPDPIFINTDDPDNPYQQFFRQLIAEVTDPEQDPRGGFVVGDPDSPRQITQLLFADLMMTTARTTNDADQPGLPLLVAIPWTMLPGTDVGGNADEIEPEDDLMTPWQLGTVGEENHYDFELVNASDETGAHVLIYDGVIYDPNSDGVDPDGMPSDDNYILDVDDGDEVWVGMTIDQDAGSITSAWIDHGPSTPDNEEGTAYITIGHVSVDFSGDIPIVTPVNEVCGDIAFDVLPITGLDDTKSYVWGNITGTQKWIETCIGTCD